MMSRRRKTQKQLILDSVWLRTRTQKIWRRAIKQARKKKTAIKRTVTHLPFCPLHHLNLNLT
jgi:hypothetical protein